MPPRRAPVKVCTEKQGIHYDVDFDSDEDGMHDRMPLLDCVADMQVVYRFDINDDGLIGTAPTI